MLWIIAIVLCGATITAGKPPAAPKGKPPAAQKAAAPKQQHTGTPNNFQEKRILATCNRNGIIMLDQFLGNDADIACQFFGLQPYTATAPMDTVLASVLNGCYGAATPSAWVAGQCTAFGQINPTSGTTQLRACTNLFRVACTSAAPPPVINQLTLTSSLTRSTTTTEFDFSTNTVILSSITSTTTTSALLQTATSIELTFTVSTVFATLTTTGVSTRVSTITSTVVTGTTEIVVTTVIPVPSTFTVTRVSTVPVTLTLTTTSTRAVPYLTTVYSCPVTTAKPLTTTTSLFFTTTTTSLVECPSTVTRTVGSTRSRLAIVTVTSTQSAVVTPTTAAMQAKSDVLTCPFVTGGMLLVLTPADRQAARSVCQQLGLKPIALTDDNFNDAAVVVGRCLGARGAAWVGSWMADGASCAALEASGVLGFGSRVREAPCDAALPVLCQ